jgi:ABC-2 type transport system permease protein
MLKIKTLSANLFSKRNKALLKELVKTEFKLRYQGSALGYAWSLLKPLGLFSILYVVFVKFLRIGGDVPNFPVYLLLGIVLWNFFAEATFGALGSIVGRGDVIRKIKFPKYIIVISGTVNALINLAFNLFVVLVFALIAGADLGMRSLLAPIFIIQLYVLALGIGLFLSALYVKFRDISHIWEVLMQGAFYATPILYPVNIILDNFNPIAAKIVMLNPVAQIIQDMRFLLVTEQTKRTTDIVQLPFSLIPYVFVLLSLALGTIYFRKKSKYFAEHI